MVTKWTSLGERWLDDGPSRCSLVSIEVMLSVFFFQVNVIVTWGRGVSWTMVTSWEWMGATNDWPWLVIGCFGEVRGTSWRMTSPYWGVGVLSELRDGSTTRHSGAFFVSIKVILSSFFLSFRWVSQNGWTFLVFLCWSEQLYVLFGDK